ncbi:MAG: hypothetical protein CO183_02365 [Candidatus Zambryskibacteria bacterium CG_4_9_14_3_um_filter_42_9]|nr:MAG: hypothetical protein CO183_02365 [Candidatus Zambryskibacteria bacterium CG_4_9_14_3_um_filter_42_9]
MHLRDSNSCFYLVNTTTPREKESCAMPKTALAIQDVRRDLKITSRKKKAVNSGEPITSLVARHSRMNILDEPLPDIVAEHDTFISGTGDGDTI